MATSTNFKQLLSIPATGIEKPKPLPIGTYEGIIHSHTLGESRDNKTPYVRLNIKPTSPGPDVDIDALNASGGSQRLSKVSLNHDFWLTEDSLYRLVDFFKLTLKVDIEGKNLEELIAQELNNKPIKFELAHNMGKDNETVYSNIARLLPVD